MQQFEIDETLVEMKKAKKENNKKNKIHLIITFISLIFILVTFIIIYIRNLKLLHKEKEKNKDLKEIVDDLIKEKNDIKNIIYELIKWKRENEKRKKEENEDDFIDYDIDSILLNNNEIQLISKKLIKKEKEKDKVIYNLIYRASKDGKNANSYHNKCNEKINTLTVVQTVKGNKFGGYTETRIQESNKGYKDPKSFIFSLDKMKIYENLNKEGKVIRHYRGYGPFFVGGFVVFDSNFYNTRNNYVYDKSSSSNFFSREDEDFELNNGEEFFAIREVEVFEIFYE